MDAECVFPTPYAGLNALLADLLAAVRAVLGGQFVGLYLHGSLAGGDYDPARSDVDFVVATQGRLDAAQCAALSALHTRLAEDSPWARHMEGSYIPLAALRRHDPADTDYPALRVDGTFAVNGHGADWIIQRHVLRERGVTLAGPPPEMLVDPVPPAELRRAALATLEEWWAPQLADPHRLLDAEYQAYAVLTMARALYTLAHGQVASKPAAARWAQSYWGEPYAALVARALAWRPGGAMDDLPAALELIRATLARAHEWAAAGPPK